MQFIYKARYLKQFHRFSRQDQVLIHETDRHIRAYYATRQAAFGLGVKRLYANASLKIFEARVTRATRIVWVEQDDAVYFGLVGSHNDVQQYLRSLR